MDELATSAAVSAMDIDSDGDEDALLETADGNAEVNISIEPAVESTDTAKDDNHGLPVNRRPEATLLKVRPRPGTSCTRPCSQP